MLMLVLMNEIFFFLKKKNATQKDRKIERMRLCNVARYRHREDCCLETFLVGENGLM
jgi:hypothetical protein